MSAPYPEMLQVCAMCKQPWEDHVKAAYWKLAISSDDAMPTDAEVEDAISFQECIHLLKMANMGPQGPKGDPG